MMTDIMTRFVVIAELVGGEHDGRRMITEWNAYDDIVRSIYIPIVTAMSMALETDDGIPNDAPMVLEYRVGNAWCVYRIDAQRFDLVIKDMRDTIYNARWQVTKYHLEKGSNNG